MELPCQDCASGYVLPGEPRGIFKDGAYLATTEQTNDGPTGEKRALVLLTDVFGLHLKNPKILADSFSERLGCDVFVPDLFNGHPPFAESDLAPYIPDTPEEQQSLINRLKWLMTIIRTLPTLFVNRPSVGLHRATVFIENLKKTKGYSKIGVVGYCYGGGLALGVATRRGLTDAVVSCHPGPVDIASIREASVPLAILCSERDEWLPSAKRDLAEAALKGNDDIESKFMLFLEFLDMLISIRGTAHGFATRPNLEIPKVKEGFEGALDESCNWLRKYIG